MNYIQQVNQVKKDIQALKHKKGFTLIETLFVVLIISLLATLIGPRFFNAGTKKIDKFVGRLNHLVNLGAQKAQETQTIQEISFNLTAKKVELKTFGSKTAQRFIDINKGLELEEFFIDNKSQFIFGSAKHRAFFFINPQGIAQNVKIIMLDENLNAKDPSIGRYTLTLNPFTAQFDLK